MPSSLSLDLRRRIAAAVAAGETVRAAAARFGVSPSTAVRLGQRARAGQDLAARPRGGSPARLVTGAVADWIRARLTEKPDVTVRALAAELGARGTAMTHDTVWRFMRQEGLTFKKNSGGSRTGPAQGGSVPETMERSSSIRSPPSASCSWTRPGSART